MSLNILATIPRLLSVMKASKAMVAAIAVTLLFVTLRPAFAAGETVPLVDGRLRIDLASYALVYADPTKQLTIADIAADDFATSLKPVDGQLIDFGFTDARIWTKVRLRNASEDTGVWRISHEINVTDIFRVHLSRTDPQGRQSVETVLTLNGDSTFAQRPVSHRLPASDVRLAPGEEVAIFIEYETGQATQMPLFVETIDSFNERVRFEDVIIIAPLAFAAGMAIISTLYLAALGMRAAILYGTYILLATLHLFHADGYAFQYFWPNLPQWNAIAMGPIGISIGCFGSFFTWAFIEARKHHPFFAVALPATGLLAALFAVGFPWFV
ncbi:MAG: 7TM-DISM domain-containing protein, partial [Pseudomonadota bacterium]